MSSKRKGATNVPMRWQKNIWWGLLMMSGGGSLAMLVLSIALLEVAPPIWWIWPPLTLVSVLMLRRCYRIEPSTLKGFWHLRLEDLLCAGLYAGFLLAVLKSLLGLLFLKIGITFAIINAITVIIGFLAAQKKGIASRFYKLTFAFAYGTRAVGLVATGALFAVAFMDGLQFHQPWHWMGNVFLNSGYIMREDAPWLLLHRMSLACLPIGAFLLLLVNRWISRTQPAQDTQPAGMKIYLSQAYLR
jgi:hypothetical protein